VVIPAKLSARERKVWEELREASGEPDRTPAEKSLLQQLKDVLRG
jgi:hypothetical protein